LGAGQNQKPDKRRTNFPWRGESIGRYPASNFSVRDCGEIVADNHASLAIEKNRYRSRNAITEDVLEKSVARIPADKSWKL
jgi:hypothetical protein